MKDKKEIEYIEGDQLIQGEKYIKHNISFTYDYIGNNEKPYLLNNGIRLNHIPTISDIGINNLKPCQYNSELTQDEVRAIQSKGGTNSVGNRRQRKTFKESIDFFLSLDATKQDLNNLSDDIKNKLPEGCVLSQADIIILKALEQAKDGSDKFSVFLRDTVGEKPTNDITVQADIITEGDRALLDKLSKRLSDK